jgi:hypothetical protein
MNNAVLHVPSGEVSVRTLASTGTDLAPKKRTVSKTSHDTKGRSGLAYQNLPSVSREVPVVQRILTCRFVPTQMAIG